MQNTLDSRVTFSRPEDQSLGAYKAWIMDIAGRLITDTASFHLTEQEWIKSWKEYWQQESEEQKFGTKEQGGSH